jgi:pimeloyl-ACP methyl ester carboxylesterase
VEFASDQYKIPRKSHTKSGWRLEYALVPVPGKNVTANETPRTLFAFHGFARPLEDLTVLADQWPSKGTMISVHLPHHGASGPKDANLPPDAPLHPALLNQLLIEIATKEGVAAPNYDLAGYSIGGRIALALFTNSPNMWGRIALLATDGLKKSPFYQLTVHSKLGKLIWFGIDRHADFVMRCSDLLLKRRIISHHLHGFCAFHISNHSMRMMVWHGWRAHRLCWPTHQKIAYTLQSWPGRMDLAFGAYDRIIPAANGQKLQRLTRTNPKVHFHLLPTGHGMLKPAVVQKLIHRIFPS